MGEQKLLVIFLLCTSRVWTVSGVFCTTSDPVKGWYDGTCRPSDYASKCGVTRRRLPVAPTNESSCQCIATCNSVENPLSQTTATFIAAFLSWGGGVQFYYGNILAGACIAAMVCCLTCSGAIRAVLGQDEGGFIYLIGLFCGIILGHLIVIILVATGAQGPDCPWIVIELWKSSVDNVKWIEHRTVMRCEK